MRRPARHAHALARLLLFCALLALTQPQASPEPPFTVEETARVLALGPWPPALSPDPSNRVSGNAQAIVLGRRLFFDARMSAVGYIACVTCHQTDRAWTDNKARAHGMADVPRNTPTLANLRLQRWYGWAGGADSLWMQSILPILDPREIDSSPALVKRVFKRDPELACLYERVFHVKPEGADDVVLANVGKALAAFQETLLTGRTPFDAFRDALARHQAHASPYPVAAQRGL
ncbi:MAG TPA: cytochrome-c peroxidase, partial [Burkholderiaceae bacterium]|nr:cytochrome-c peroxidase [Burkholderiaceae bacterium]